MCGENGSPDRVRAQRPAVVSQLSATQEELRLEFSAAQTQALDLGRERSCPRQSELVREREHPLGEPVVLAEQVALTVSQMRELCRDRIEVWEPFDGHGSSYRQGAAST